MSSLLRTMGLTSYKPGLTSFICQILLLSYILRFSHFFSYVLTYHILVCKSITLFCHPGIYLTLFSSIRNLQGRQKAIVNWLFFMSFLGLNSGNQYFDSFSLTNESRNPIIFLSSSKEPLPWLPTELRPNPLLSSTAWRNWTMGCLLQQKWVLSAMHKVIAAFHMGYLVHSSFGSCRTS